MEAASTNIEAGETASTDAVDEFGAAGSGSGNSPDPCPAQATNPVFMSRVTSPIPWIIDGNRQEADWVSQTPEY